jgi:hypothetical protein
MSSYTTNIAQVAAFSHGYNDCSFAFEFVPMNVNASFGTSVEFDSFEFVNGFTQVDAVTTIDVPYTGQFDRLFFFDSDDTFTTDPASGFTDASYGILGTESAPNNGKNPFDATNTDNIRSVAYSDSTVKAGWANNSSAYTPNTTLKQDYIRYTAKRITGGYALEDVFRNEADLIQGVVSMNELFTDKLRDKVEEIKNLF